MYCPKCGAENLEGVSYCRACGSDLRLVPQALAGQLPTVRADDDAATNNKNRRRKKESPPSVAKGVEMLTLGIGFLFVSVMIGLFMPGGKFWWFWMLIPAFSLIGSGASQIIRAKQHEAAALPAATSPPYFPPSPPQEDRELPPPPAASTAEITMPPPSVTEGTTRHLSQAAPRRRKGEPS